MTRTYLSIDLDYWLGPDSGGKNPLPLLDSGLVFLNKVWDICFEQKIPVDIQHRHHHLLPHMDSIEFDCLRNIDFHSDVIDEVDGFLTVHEGSWVNVVDNCWQKDFVWHHPDRYYQAGRCDNAASNRWTPETYWKSIKHVQGASHALLRDTNEQIVGIGICGFSDVEHIRTTMLADNHDWISAWRTAYWYHNDGAMWFERMQTRKEASFPMSPRIMENYDVSCLAKKRKKLLGKKIVDEATALRYI